MPYDRPSLAYVVLEAAAAAFMIGGIVVAFLFVAAP